MTKREVCESKKVYNREKQAWKFSAFVFAMYGDYSTPYKCEICHKFHLTQKRAKKEPGEKFVKVFNKWFGEKVL